MGTTPIACTPAFSLLCNIHWWLFSVYMVIPLEKKKIRFSCLSSKISKNGWESIWSSYKKISKWWRWWISVPYFLEHLNQCGILHWISCLATPEQNGVAERKHWHIVEMGLTIRSLLFGLPCYVLIFQSLNKTKSLLVPIL